MTGRAPALPPPAPPGRPSQAAQRSLLHRHRPEEGAKCSEAPRNCFFAHNTYSMGENPGTGPAGAAEASPRVGDGASGTLSGSRQRSR